MTQHPQEIFWAAIARRWSEAYAVMFLFALMLVPQAFSQLTTGSLSGTVRDATGAVIPTAKVTLQNNATNDTRVSVSNNSGYFTFAGVQPGSYTVTVTAQGFKTWKQTGIVMNSGDVRSVSGIALQVGSATVSVSVSASPAQMVPIDSGERSDVISSADLEKLSLEGRNVSELLKVLPGVTLMPNGSSGGSWVDMSTAGVMENSTIGNGYSASGAPYRGGSSFLIDGANIIDPGCNCNSIAAPDPDMTAEVKVSQGFSADTPNGPEVVNVTSKGGTSQFHGQAYFYARHQALNSNTWLNNHNSAAKQPGQYFYPGGNVGGPILIPHTNFNANRKLLFWFGYEYFKQTLPSGAPLESFIPSPGMMAGDFSANGNGNSVLCPKGLTSGTRTWCDDPTGSVDANGNTITDPSKVPVDPGAAAIMKMFPKANADPTKTGGYNYYLPYSNQQNGYIWRGRIDYNINDNNKVFVAYQQGTTTVLSPAHAWWNPWLTVAYPGGALTTPEISRVMTVNFVSVIRPTLTNEFVFGWGFGSLPFKPTNLQAIYKSTLDYPYQTLYNGASPVAPSLNTAGWETFPDLSQPAFYGPSGVFVNKKQTPTFSDNVTKVWRTHTFKVGGFTTLVGNDGSAWSTPNGIYSIGSGPAPNDVIGRSKGLAAGTLIGSTNPTANLVQGIASGFSQNNFAPVQDMAYRTISFYLQDNWQVRPRLTLNVGMRWDHIGRWYDRQGLGLAVWYPQLFAQDVATNQAAKAMVVEYPGVRWKGIDSGIPNSGYPTRLAWATPRVGFAYDLQGHGETVIRGGWGEYVWNDMPGGQLSTSQNMMSYNSPGGEAITFAQVAQQPAASNNMPAGSVTAAPYNDFMDPLTYAWNLTVDRQMPWRSMLEAAYVGNSTHHMELGEQTNGSGIAGGMTNVNNIPLGALFKTDPVTGAAAPTDPENTGTYNIVDYHPYSGCVVGGGCYGYGTNSITVNQHLGYANYNGLQVAWMKQSGHASFNFNYTWSKTLGIMGATVDAFNVHNNYGIDNIDRPQVFNASYSYGVGKIYRGGQKLVSGVANGWNISGITTFQAGGHLQAVSSENFGLSLQQPNPANPTTLEGLSSKTYFGTDANMILATTTCNPKSGLKSHQLLNLSCFTAPKMGTQGQRMIHPYLSGPSYFDSDLTIFKTFNVTERQNVEFRASAFDFMNHSLWGLSSNNRLSLSYVTLDGGQTFSSSYTDPKTGKTSNLLAVDPSQWGVEDQKSPYSGAGYARIIELSVKYNF